MNGEPISLRIGKQYIVIDALYLMYIKDLLPRLSGVNLDDIRKMAFPYTDTPFAEYAPSSTSFLLSDMKTISSSQIKNDDKRIFAVDSGMIIFVNIEILIDFLLVYDFYELLGRTDTLIDFGLWTNWVSNHEALDTAIIVSPDIEAGFEFQGSGMYQISPLINK